MKILVACEFSGIVRDAFRELGHDAVSCDYLPSERPGPHIRGDVRKVLYTGEWDMLIAFPPCQYLARSGIHWMYKIPGRVEQATLALDFVAELLAAPIEKICIENSYGLIGTHICKPDQKIQPNWFGHWDAKTTCLWLKNLPRLHPTNRVFLPPGGHWNNVLPSGQHRRIGKKTRAHNTARTYWGVARAMAGQWGGGL